MKNVVLIHLSICLVFSAAVKAQKDLLQDLLVCHADMSAEGQKVFRQKIYAYHFVNGTYTGREELLVVDGKQGGRDHIRFDRGINTLYKGRYLITGIGNVLDLKEKKVLFDGKARLVSLRNDSAIYYTNDAFKGKFYSVYDFRSLQYSEVKNLLFKARFEQDIEFDKSSKPFRINYYPQGKAMVELLADAGYGQQNIRNYRHVPDPPVYWISEREFLYGHFSQSGSEVSINRFNISNLEKKQLGTVQTGLSTLEARFEMRETGLQFVCGNSLVYIDSKNNSIQRPEFCREQKGFSYALNKNEKGRAIHFNGKEIGCFSFDTDHFKAGEHIVAAVKVLTVGEDNYQQGMLVWSGPVSGWQKIEAEEVVSLIGWVDAGK